MSYLTFNCFVEGVTDFKVIKKFLYQHYKNPNLLINRIHPPIDETDKNKGGWSNLMNHFKTDLFKDQAEFAENIVIQIDSDIYQDLKIDYRKVDHNNKREIENLIKEIKEKIIDAISPSFFEIIKEKVFFAISVHSTECWLLPLFYSDNKKSKIENCIVSLNQKLKTKGFTINPKAKNAGGYYDSILKNIKTKDVKNCAKNQLSLNLFLKSLPQL